MSFSTLLAYLKGSASERKAVRRLSRSTGILKLFYLGGHPGIWNSDQPFLVGRVADQIRLVSGRGTSAYDLPIERIRGVTYDDAGLLRIAFEPTAGLVTSVDFLVAGEAPVEQAYSRLLYMVTPGA